MLNQLLKLYRKSNSKKTPLEDFVTETFAGLLRMEHEIRNEFLFKFLNLPNDEYVLKTQVKYDLKNDISCIVDFVIEGNSNICFIENKVNSKEGYRQLERYGKVLNTFLKNGYSTKLIYCTKLHDNKEYHFHNFKQIKWHNIALFLRKHNDNSFVSEFITFLTNHKMAQNLTLSSQEFLTFDNLQNTVQIINGYMDRVKPIFIETFKSKNRISDYRTIPQIIKYNRMAYLFKEIIGGDNHWSEIKYGFNFNTPSVYVGIWISKTNTNFTQFVTEIELVKNDFIIIKTDIGISIELKKNISIFLNDDKAESKIAEWYKQSFIAFEKLIINTNKLEWKINVS